MRYRAPAKAKKEGNWTWKSLDAGLNSKYITAHKRHGFRAVRILAVGA
jgi:hypothetical protein